MISSDRATGSLTTRMGILLLITALCSSLANTFLPQKIPWIKAWDDHLESKALHNGIQVVDLDETRSIVDGHTHLIFDARPTIDYDEGHLPNALSLPFQEIDEAFEQIQVLCTPEQPLLVYCSGKECDEALQVCLFLQGQGLTNTFLFLEGYRVWEEAMNQGVDHE